VTCVVRKEFEDYTRKGSLNHRSLPFASGVRTEGREGAIRLINHLKSNGHLSACEAKRHQELLKSNSTEHPWLSCNKKHRVDVNDLLIHLVVTVHNDSIYETLSARSWLARQLSQEYASSLISTFK
jgi:hypothetical protein